jgi:hypothetical protein
MTNKEAFKKNMEKCGLKVTETEDTLTMISANGKMKTTYIFDKDGAYMSIITKTL